MRYQDKFTFSQRAEYSSDLLKKYPDRKPVIVYNSRTKSTYKLLLLNHHVIGIILQHIKQRMKIDKSDAIYVFINKTIIPQTTDTIESIYNQYKDQDGYLYLDAHKENTFG